MFKRTKEDFACEHCGAYVEGNGYTNHCPACLWSKHVDVDPGDRLSACGGMMEPIRFEIKAGEERVIQRCTRCGHERPNKVLPEDEREILLKLSSRS